MTDLVSTQSFKNRLLDLCDRSEVEQILPHLDEVTLEFRRPLYEPGQPIDWVYFPRSGVISLVVMTPEGAAAEVGTIGNEGMLGIPTLLGQTQTPMAAYVQVPGSGLRMRASLMADHLRHNNTVRAVLLSYVHVFFNQVAQAAGCNVLHSLDQRCCRWLLMTHDRVQGRTFLLTQEFLGMMLGVQRTSVTMAMLKLKQRDLIDYNRGTVTVHNRRELEKCSCGCYRIMKREFDRLLGQPLGEKPVNSGSSARATPRALDRH
jgi:CRP-like cAMP-binding protein